jgi:hypothetical protein
MAIVGPFWDARLFYGRLAMHALTKNMQIIDGFDSLDASCFGDAAHVVRPGLANVQFSFNGLVELTDDMQDEYMAAHGGAVSNIPISMMLSNTPTVGTKAKFFVCQLTNYQFGGVHGELLPFAATGSGSNGHRLINGYVLEVGSTARTSTFNGTAVQMGAVGASQYLYGAIHVTSASASDTLDVVIASAATEGGAYTTRMTFTQATDETTEYPARVAGPFTDSWWRVTATIAGSDPSFTFAVVAGIL